MIRDKVNEYSSWLQNMVDSMKIIPKNVSEYCTQVQAIDHIDENFHMMRNNLDEKMRMFQLL